MPLRIGETFAGYRVLQLLGSGGMGEVYLVQHPRLPRQEALKVLRPDISRDTSFRERFIREADLAAGLRHPHIVGVHDRGEHDGQMWIAMDYIEGTDLSRLLKQRYPAGMPVGHVLPIVSAVASALDYAHKKGLLHRDVKPANIIVADLETDDPSVLLADFGIARPLDETSGITTANMTVGTVAYAAPEQLMGLPLDGRADQYALAVTAYELLTGSLPFEHSNPVVIASHHLNASAPPLSRLRPALADLDPVLAIALAKESGDRFATSTDFAHALAGAKGVALYTSSRPTLAAPSGGTRLLSGVEERRSPPAAEKTSTDLPRTPVEVHEPRAHWPVIASTLAMVVLLAAVAVVLVVGPWRHDGTSNGTTGTPTIAPAMTFESMRDFVTGYYADLPARPEAAWAKVTPDGRNETGHDKFVDFWSRIQSVTLISISPRDSTSVVARLDYVRKDGGTDTEDRWLRMAVVNSAIQLQESGRIGPASDPPSPVHDPTSSPTTTAVTTADEYTPTVVNCSGLPEVKPQNIILTCADNTWAVDNIVWKTWSAAAGAYGTGIEFSVSCVPNCAQGSATYSPVSITLTGAIAPTFRYTNAVITNQNTGTSYTSPLPRG